MLSQGKNTCSGISPWWFLAGHKNGKKVINGLELIHHAKDPDFLSESSSEICETDDSHIPGLRYRVYRRNRAS